MRHKIVRYWTPEEDAALISFLEKKLSVAVISVKLRRSQAAIFTRSAFRIFHVKETQKETVNFWRTFFCGCVTKLRSASKCEVAAFEHRLDL